MPIYKWRVSLDNRQLIATGILLADPDCALRGRVTSEEDLGRLINKWASPPVPPWLRLNSHDIEAIRAARALILSLMPPWVEVGEVGLCKADSEYVGVQIPVTTFNPPSEVIPYGS